MNIAKRLLLFGGGSSPIPPFTAGDWSVEWLRAGGVFATGGEITDVSIDGTMYRIHTVLSDDDLVVTQGGLVDAWVIAGGGGGASAGTFSGSGGGAGGVIPLLNLELPTGSHPIVVGAGGLGGHPHGNRYDGNDSSFLGNIAKGGGSGHSKYSTAGNSGGSGGGGSRGGVGGAATPPEQGSDGGDSSDNKMAGGGGYSQKGYDIFDHIQPSGNGGDGIDLSPFIGTSFGDDGWFAGGGGGTSYDDGSYVTQGGKGGGSGGCRNTPQDPSIPNTGGGGGGSGNNNYGKAGADGIVIIRYPIL